MKRIVDKIPTELQYVERSVFMKELNTQNLWTFELGTQEGINVPIWITIGFQQSYKLMKKVTKNQKRKQNYSRKNKMN